MYLFNFVILSFNVVKKMSLGCLWFWGACTEIDLDLKIRGIDQTLNNLKISLLLKNCGKDLGCMWCNSV